MTSARAQELSMPVIVPKASPEPRPSTRKSRVVRVTAKRPKQRDEEQQEEIDPDAFVAEGDATPESRTRPDNGTYLSMYFRDMAELDVLRPEEEFTSAREIEALEIMLWEAVLSHPPAIDSVLDAVQ